MVVVVVVVAIVVVVVVMGLVFPSGEWVRPSGRLEFPDDPGNSPDGE